MTAPATLQRFLDLARAFEDERGVFENSMALRYTALSLVDQPGAPGEIARRLRSLSDELREGSGWFDPMRAELRHIVAAELLRRDVPAGTFRQELDAARELFRAEGLKRGGAYELIAQMILISSAPDGGLEASVVRRFAQLYAGMSEHHFWLTSSDDYPACALLAMTDGNPATVIAHTEFFYENLRDLRFRRGNALQFVSHILTFNACSQNAALSRFHAIYHAFREAGLHMHPGDYDEVAVLTFVDAPLEEIVRHVLAHRAQIAELRPRPSKDLSYSLACSTALLELAPELASLEQIERARRAASIQTLVQAQQVAAASVAAGVAATTS